MSLHTNRRSSLYRLTAALLITAAAFTLLFAATALAESKVWTRQFNRSGESKDNAGGVAVGPAGSVVVIGTTWYPPDLES